MIFLTSISQTVFHLSTLYREQTATIAYFTKARHRHRHRHSGILYLSPVESGTTCKSILLVVERAIPCTSILQVVQSDYTLHVHIDGCCWCYSCCMILTDHLCRIAGEKLVRHRLFSRQSTSSVRHRHSGIGVSPVPLVTE